MSKPIEFIAEIGMNHNGNFGLIPELIRQASQSGANYAKFQLGWRDKADEINSLGKEEVEYICKYCDFFSIKPLFSVFHADALDLLLSTSYDKSAIKVASRTLANDPDLVRKIALFFRRLFISTGMVERSFIPDLAISNAEYLWCVSEYPLHPFNINDFPDEFTSGTFCGLSDHTQGPGLAMIAASRGARIIERHFTLDKSNTTIRDHALSSTPDEFRDLVLRCNDISRILPYINPT